MKVAAPSAEAATDRIGLRVVLVILAGLGLYLAAWLGPTQVLEASGSAGWPTAAGRVVVSELQHTSRRGRGVVHTLTVRYRYEVAGQTHEGERWGVAQPLEFSSRAAAQRFRDQGYREGDPVTVHYNPADPGSAVLVVGGGFRGWITTGFGVLAMAVSSWLFLRYGRTG